VGYLIHRERHIYSEERKSFNQRLSEKHSVKGVTMVHGKFASSFGMFNGDGQSYKSMHHDRITDRTNEVQFAGSSLDSDFPGDNRAYKDLIAWCRYGVSLGFRETEVPLVPPDENMGVEEEPHLLKTEVLKDFFRQGRVEVVSYVGDAKDVQAELARIVRIRGER